MLNEPIVRPGLAISTGIGFLAIHEARGKTPYQVVYAKIRAGAPDFHRWVLEDLSKAAATLAAGRRDKVLEILGAK